MFQRFLNVSDTAVDDFDQVVIIRNEFIAKLVTNLAPGTDSLKIHCAAQILNELTEFKAIYQEICNETNLGKMLEYIESGDAESQKGAFWVLGYSALKYKMHEGLTSRVSIINENEDEEVNMLDDDEKTQSTE